MSIKNKKVITMIVAGTGSFYCGTCIRDYGFYIEAKNNGYNINFAPLYLPVITDSFESQKIPLIADGIQLYFCFKFPRTWRLFHKLSYLTNSNSFLKWVSNKFSMTNAAEIGTLTAQMILGDKGRVNGFLEVSCKKIIDKYQTEVVILSNLLLIGLAPILKKMYQVKVFCILQGEIPFLNTLDERNKNISIVAINESIDYVDGFISVSDYYKKETNAVFPKMESKNHTVYNGVSTSSFMEQKNDKPIIGFLSRFCVDKGLDKLIDAFITLRKKGVVCELNLIGACLKEDHGFVLELKSKLVKAGLEEDVAWYPNADVDTKMQVLRTCRCLSVPAMYGESFGLYLLESLALGVPVVQPNIAAFHEIVTKTQGGLLFEPKESADYEEKLLYFLVNKTEANRMGLVGQKAVKEHFMVNNMVKNQMAIMGLSNENK